MFSLFVHVFHRVIVYITIFGFLLPKKYLLYHLLLFPIMLVHWILNDNKCILTELEVKLSGKSWGESSREFSIKVLRTLGFKLENVNMKREDRCNDKITQIYITIYGISWFISLVRYIYG